MAGVASRTQRALCDAARYSTCARRKVPRLDGCAAQPSRQDLSGAMVASLSVPWGDTGNERGGYHLVWPLDLVETAGALLALGAEQEARDTLRYLIATQIEDG